MPPQGHVTLSSMHKYQPRIIIARTSDPRNFLWAPAATAVFPETEFIAVTAYQVEITIFSYNFYSTFLSYLVRRIIDAV